MTKLRIVAVACALIAGAACSKKEEKKALPPAQNWQAPPAAAGDTAQPGAGMANPHGGGATAGNPHGGGAAAMGGSDPHAAMGGGNPHAPQGGGMDVTQMGLQPPDPNRPIDPNKHLKGTIKPSPETKASIPEGSTIFISVKRLDANTGAGVGAPLAAKRLRFTSWPVWFQLTEEDAMIQGTPFEGDVVITAWADQDNDAISKSPGDVLGTLKAKIPAGDLVVTLDQVIK